MKTLKIRMKAHGDMKDITDEVAEYIKECDKESGAVLIFSKGSTGAITTIEYEPGLKKDFPQVMDKIAPYGNDYEHHKTWHDDNGSSHVKASIVGPSLIVPFRDKELILGTWQQIVVVNFDTGDRVREVILQVL
jgi:secondary thiamine-phosphate synthase enzyme